MYYRIDAAQGAREGFNNRDITPINVNAGRLERSGVLTRERKHAHVVTPCLQRAH
jgi:hypothetical protein